MKIEQATTNDAAEILALQKLAYVSEAEIYDDFGIQPLTQTLDSLVREFETHTLFKAVQDGRIVGSVRTLLDGGTCCAGKLIVHPEAQIISEVFVNLCDQKRIFNINYSYENYNFNT